jgi:hypothetical protein
VCYIYNGQSERENKKHPSSRVHFLLQKNTGNDERQIMTSKEVVSLALFSGSSGIPVGKKCRFSPRITESIQIRCHARDTHPEDSSYHVPIIL